MSQQNETLIIVCGGVLLSLIGFGLFMRLQNRPEKYTHQWAINKATRAAKKDGRRYRVYRDPISPWMWDYAPTHTEVMTWADGTLIEWEQVR